MSEEAAEKIRHLEEELEATKKQLYDIKVVFDNILDSTLAGYWDWYIQDNYEYLSPTFKKMFGYEDHEMENSPDSWQKIIHPDDLPLVFETFDKHAQSKGKIPYDNEVRYYHKDGSIVHVYCRGKIIEWDTEGNPKRMVGCHVDITKLKEAEETEKLVRKLRSKNHELEQFAYVASHDMQEPLRSINSFIEIFKEEYSSQFDDNAKLYMDYISQGATRMSSLIKDLLEYSRLGRDRQKMFVDCNLIVNTALKDLNTSIVATGAIVKTDELPTVWGYEFELRLLFQNLLSNAIKFRSPDRITHIQIEAFEKGKYWKFTVRDNGIGIASEHHKKIFTIFQRLHNQKQYEGTGIGLSQCKKIVDLHDGTIEVKSEPNRGSTFEFTILK